MAYERSDNEARLQRKLIPLNIVVCILCLVAAISLLFAPLVKINLNDLSDLKELIVNSSEDGEYDDDSNSDSDSDSELPWGIDEKTFMTVMIDVLFDDELSFSAIDLVNFANSDERVMLPYLLSKTSKIMGRLMDMVIIPAIIQDSLEELGVDTEDFDFSVINEKFDAFNHVKSEEDMRNAASDWIDEIARVGNYEIDPEGKEQALEYYVDIYYDTIEVTGGDFSIEKYVCIVFSEGMGLDEPITSYEDLFDTLLSDSGDFEDVEDEQTAEMLEMFDTIDEAIKALAQGVFGMVLFSAVTWLILFLFSLLHIFARNKRFVMWYVKMFGGIPWFFFGFIPMTIGGALSSAGGDAAIVGTLFGAITSFTWISGVCLGLLWLVSIFWAFPIKRKIRADRKG